MRISLLLFMAVLVSGLLVIGLTIIPYQALATNSPQKVDPSFTNATINNETTTTNSTSLQPTYLTLSLTTDKAVYLSGETVNITVSTSAVNTHIHLTAQLPGGSQQLIGDFTINYSHNFSWIAPSTSGQIRLTCDGEAMIEVWDYCTRWVCTGDPPDCHWDTYPCFRTISVTGNTYNEISVFSRTASISGRITDTNQKPVPGASVSMQSTAQSTTSNSDGSYEFNSYQLGNNYGLVDGIPTVIDTVSVEAVACEPQPGKSIQVQAEHGVSEVNFTLKRAFYPPDIDLSEFTFAAFSSWPQAKEYAAWQNIAGITIDGDVQSMILKYGTGEISPLLFIIGNKKLFLITAPEFGRYSLDVQGTSGTQYKVSAASTIGGAYSEPTSVSSTIGPSGNQRLRLVLQQNQVQLQVIKPFPVALIIVLIVVGIVGGLAAAYFLTGGKARWAKAFARIKFPKTKEPATDQETVIEKTIVKRRAKRPTGSKVVGNKKGGK